MVITKTAIIKIYPGANADITASDNDICSGEEVTFTAKYITGQSYQWLPIHVFNSASGNLVRAKINEPTRVMLIASNDYCRDTAVYFVATYYCCDVIVPNAFTPNHDGLNDNARFHIDPSITLNTFYIYNRWGQLVFTTNNPTEGWDGSFKGIPQDPGTYFYFVRYSCNNIPNQIKKGDLLLIR
jgi:gliding motility-associated-like protein